MYLGGVWDGVQALAHSRERFGDEVGGALLAHAKHHGGSHIKGVAPPVVVSRAPPGYDVPVTAEMQSRMATLLGMRKRYNQ